MLARARRFTAVASVAATLVAVTGPRVANAAAGPTGNPITVRTFAAALATVTTATRHAEATGWRLTSSSDVSDARSTVAYDAATHRASAIASTKDGVYDAATADARRGSWVLITPEATSSAALVLLRRTGPTYAFTAGDTATMQSILGGAMSAQLRLLAKAKAPRVTPLADGGVMYSGSIAAKELSDPGQAPPPSSQPPLPDFTWTFHTDAAHVATDLETSFHLAKLPVATLTVTAAYGRQRIALPAPAGVVSAVQLATAREAVKLPMLLQASADRIAASALLRAARAHRPILKADIRAAARSEQHITAHTPVTVANVANGVRISARNRYTKALVTYTVRLSKGKPVVGTR